MSTANPQPIRLPATIVPQPDPRRPPYFTREAWNSPTDAPRPIRSRVEEQCAGKAGKHRARNNQAGRKGGLNP